ncbi:isochorismatase family hydrolase [Myriangium duriaei CBS 260.36]|uniref:nicotinamidase n=1 Tax=Myriangium duriaei CBS 260.36 TaxID=1168546 RepID=A0A9P4MG05_9PEZI|nr:isochorismatase family hydrolase [Myriangium duriaei CBS 260.36]
MSSSFRPALVVVDFQNDFCPPDGALAVDGGRDIAPTINALLGLPFILRIATKDFHPANHVSFASNHPPPHNKPFESVITVQNPDNPDETQEVRLWPVHCVQGTQGSELISEFKASKCDHIIEKAQDARVEMYSAFAAPFSKPQIAVSALTDILKDSGVTHVYTVGLAYDYCVKYTAIDSAKAGFVTYLLKDASKAVHQDDAEAMRAVDEEMRKHGVHIITSDSKEVDRVRSLTSS